MKKLICLFLINSLLSAMGMYGQYHQQAIDSMVRIVENPPETDRELLLTYVRLAQTYKSVDPEKAMECARQGVGVAQEKKSLYWSAELHYMIGESFHALSHLDSALYYFNLSSDLQQQAVEEGTEDKTENDYLELYILNSIGSIHTARGNFDAALELYFKGLAIAERIDDPEEVIGQYLKLAHTYFSMSNYEKAEAYYLKQKQLAIEINNPIYIAHANIGLCPLLNARGDYATALEYGEEAYRIYLSYPQTIPSNLMNATMCLTEIWMKIPDYNKAMEYAQATVGYARQTGSPSFLASALYTLSTVYLRQEKYAECEQTAFDALAADSTNIYINSIIYGNIAQANIWLGNAKKGIEYFSKTMNANRAYSNKNFQASLSEMEVKYETEKKETRITTLEEERRLMAWLGLSGIAVLLLAMAFLFFLWRWSVQEKRLIATQAVLDGETAERVRLARDLHDGLGSMLTGVKLNLESMKNGVTLDKTNLEHFDNAFGMLNESMVELRRVAHHLMPDSLSRYGLKVALADFCTNFPSITYDYFGSEERLDSKMEVVIYRIIHELVNNALKHSDATEIMVQVIRETEYIALIVRDNGKGFDTSLETKGMGLRNIRDRVASYVGRMDINSQTNKGTEINIEIKTTKEGYGNK